MSYTPFIWPLLISALITGGVVFYTRRYQNTPLTHAFRRLMGLVTVWSLLYALGISVSDLSLRILLLSFIYLPSVFTALASFTLALEYTGNGAWLTRRRLNLFLILSALFLTIAFTSPWHHLWRYDYHLAWSGSIFLVASAMGPVYWMYIGYMTLVSIATIAILITAFRYRTLYFRNTLILTLGLILPIAVGFLYVMRLLPIRGFDWTPVSFIWLGTLFGWALLRGRLFDVIPVARTAVVENLQDLMVVLNPAGLILDFNRSAQTLLGLSPSVLGTAPTDLPPPWGEIFQRYAETPACKEEVLFGVDGQEAAYELTISPIQDEQGRTLGKFFLFHDISKRKRFEAAEREQRILAEALRDTAEALTSTLDFDGVLEKILENVGRVVPIDSASIALLDETGGLQYVRFHGYPPEMIAKIIANTSGVFLQTSPIYKQAYETGDPIIISDTHNHPDWILTESGAWIRSYANMPIRIKDRVVGFLNLDSRSIGFYTPRHIDNLRAFADQVAVAVENSRLYAAAEREIEERRHVDRRLRQLSRAVEQSPSSIVITDTQGNIEYVNPRFSQITGYSLEEALGQNPRILKSGRTPPETYRQLWETILAGGEWRGELVNRKKNGEEYFEAVSISPITDSRGVVTHFVAVKEDITGRKQAEEEIHQVNRQLQLQLDEIRLLQDELREQAIRDPLTGLYNRRYLDEMLEHEFARAERDGTPISFVMIDIDHFKNLNDRFGHGAGDAILKKLAAQLLGQSRVADIICRYGGEEFLAVLPNIKAEAAQQVAERWRKLFLGSTLPLQYGDAMSTISCGIAEFPQHGETGDELITMADRAMYQAKALGRNRVVIWQGDPLEGELQV